MHNIHLSRCFVSAIRADLVKGRATISFEASLDQEMLAIKSRLAMLAVEEMPVSLTITSPQGELFNVNIMPVGEGVVVSGDVDQP